MPKIVSPKDKRQKIVRLLVNESELKTLKQLQKKAKISSLAEFIRSTILNQKTS